MKNTDKLFLAMAAFIGVAVSCVEPGETASPVIDVVSSYCASGEAAEHKIQYEVCNPLDGGVLSAVVQSDWLTGLDADDEVISFSLSENNTGEERSAVISLSYPEAADVELTVIQSPCAEQPVIQVESKMSVGFMASKYKLEYTVSNPVEGEMLTAGTQTDWINSIAVSENYLEIDISANAGQSSRQGQILLEYPGAESVSVLIEQKEMDVEDLSKDGTANCYIVSNSGTFGIKAVKGNTDETLGEIASAEVLWETLGTKTAPGKGDLINAVAVVGDMIIFTVADPFVAGNALIVAKGAEENIVWSWHIWLTEPPVDQVYNNDAGIMMDRNLGALSAQKGDPAANGLLYQWGRKDPFMGSATLSSGTGNTFAKSTMEWPEPVVSDETVGTIEYSVENPATFILSNAESKDWLNSGEVTDVPLWHSEKTVYDPCPPGYRVPDGGDDGVWAKALGTGSIRGGIFDNINRSFDFGSKSGNTSMTEDASCWYPAEGYISGDDGTLKDASMFGAYWSCTPANTFDARNLYFSYMGRVFATGNFAYTRAYGLAIRCVRE